MVDKAEEVILGKLVLAALIRAKGLAWVLMELGPVTVNTWLETNCPDWDYPGMEWCLGGLEGHGYPRAIIDLLRDNQHTPWLTPIPLQG